MMYEFWETHQRPHLLCAACLTGSAAICISQQPFHRRCYCLHPAYCSLPPGKQECLCEDAVCGLQLRIQYHSACHTGCEAPDSRTKQISVQLDPGLSDRQKSGGQNGQHTSSPLTLNTGAPQGCVLSPLLYSLYTHDCTATHSSNVIVKFADDTTVIGLITDNDEMAYRAEVSTLTKWCQENHLSLNIDKTKELVVDFRRQSREHTPITIVKTPVEWVNSFKFLGIHITEDLTWSAHTDAVLKKSHQRLFFLSHLYKSVCNGTVYMLIVSALYGARSQEFHSSRHMCCDDVTIKVIWFDLWDHIPWRSSVWGFFIPLDGARSPHSPHLTEWHMTSRLYCAAEYVCP